MLIRRVELEQIKDGRKTENMVVDEGNKCSEACFVISHVGR